MITVQEQFDRWYLNISKSIGKCDNMRFAGDLRGYIITYRDSGFEIDGLWEKTQNLLDKLSDKTFELFEAKQLAKLKTKPKTKPKTKTETKIKIKKDKPTEIISEVESKAEQKYNLKKKTKNKKTKK